VTRHGVLGGTFDPVHQGHLDVARAAQTALRLADVRLVPARLPPHRGAPHASASDRLAMVERAVAGVPGLQASDLELHAAGPSYTVDTLDRLIAGGADPRGLFFITGADAFRDIAMWKAYPTLLDRCHFVAVSRPGCSAPSLRQALPELVPRMIDAADADGSAPRIVLVDAPTAAVSSTDVRSCVARGRPIDGLVPAAVAAYILERGLYRHPADPERI